MWIHISSCTRRTLNKIKSPRFYRNSDIFCQILCKVCEHVNVQPKLDPHFAYIPIFFPKTPCVVCDHVSGCRMLNQNQTTPRLCQYSIFFSEHYVWGLRMGDPLRCLFTNKRCVPSPGVFTTPGTYFITTLYAYRSTFFNFSSIRHYLLWQRMSSCR